MCVRVQMQKKWHGYVRRVYQLCDPAFWRVFKSLLDQSTTCTDEVLKTVFPLVKRINGAFPRSTRTLRGIIDKKVGKFWTNVTITKTIDLRSFRIPSVSKIKFAFIDPVYVWMQQCHKLFELGHELIWRPKEMHLPGSTEPMYGAGIEYGLLLREAVKSIPLFGSVALMNLSWDSGATNMKSRSAIPICMQVITCAQ